MRVDARYLESGNARLLALRRGPDAEQPAACTLLLGPLLEEMNKSRRFLGLLATELAARRVASWLVDLRGSGDSSGDLAETGWTDWLDDVVAAHARIAALEDRAEIVVVAVRGAALLAAALLAEGRLPGVRQVVLVQPVTEGVQHLRQLLRTRVMARRFVGETESVGDLEQALARGDRVEVMGYELHAGLTTGLAAARVAPRPWPAIERVTWFEVASHGAAEPSPASVQRIADLQQAALEVELRLVVDEPFWATQEIAPASAAARAIAAAVADANA
jgi:exosortase A-associated hydrolase 2